MGGCCGHVLLLSEVVGSIARVLSSSRGGRPSINRAHSRRAHLHHRRPIEFFLGSRPSHTTAVAAAVAFARAGWALQRDRPPRRPPTERAKKLVCAGTGSPGRPGTGTTPPAAAATPREPTPTSPHPSTRCPPNSSFCPPPIPLTACVCVSCPSTAQPHARRRQPPGVLEEGDLDARRQRRRRCAGAGRDGSGP